MEKSLRAHIPIPFYKRWAAVVAGNRPAELKKVCHDAPVSICLSQSFTIYPQISGSYTELLIECRKPVEEGYYTISIWNENGRAIQQQQLWIDKGARSMNLEVAGMYSGDYYLQILEPGNALVFRDKVSIKPH